jgi:DNA-binding response OmpR family regulator
MAVMKVLVVEDDQPLAEVLQKGLGAHGHQVIHAETGEDGVLFVRTEPIDLVVLDITLPGMDGHETLAVLRRIRRDLPVVMLTAQDDIGSKVSAFDAGADDYLTKPFILDELLARIRALTRRMEQASGAALEWGDLRIDLVSRRVQRAGMEVALSRREFMLLEYFARNPHRLLSRPQILAAAWEHDFEGESNIVDVYIRYLRTKLDLPGEPSIISTVRGAGYRFDPPGG